MLVVDPTTSSRRALRAHLAFEFTVRTTHTTRAARVLLRRDVYDVIVIVAGMSAEVLMRFVGVVERDHPTTAILFLVERELPPQPGEEASPLLPRHSDALVPRIHSALAAMRARRAEIAASAGAPIDPPEPPRSRRRATPRPR